MPVAYLLSLHADRASFYLTLKRRNPPSIAEPRTRCAPTQTGLRFSFRDVTHAATRPSAIRLPQEIREEFLKRYKTSLFSAYGAVMKECVAVRDALLGKAKELQ